MEKRERKLLRPGAASFYVKYTTNTDRENKPLFASTGPRMIRVTLSVTDEAGESELVPIWFTETGLMFLERLVKALPIPGGVRVESVFDDPSMIEGLAGKCMVDVVDDAKYGKQNKVMTFIRDFSYEILAQKQAKKMGFDFNAEEELKKQKENTHIDADFDNEIPF